MNPAPAKRQLAIDRPVLEAICRKWHIRRLSLFDAAQATDYRNRLNLLAEFEPGRSPELLALVEAELSQSFDSKPIHLVTARSLPPKLRSLVLASAKLQYAARPRVVPRIVGATLIAAFFFGVLGGFYTYESWPGHPRDPLGLLALLSAGAVPGLLLIVVRRGKPGQTRMGAYVIDVTLILLILAACGVLLIWLGDNGLLRYRYH